MWKKYLLEDKINKLGYNYDILKDKCEKDILIFNIEEVAFEIILNKNKSYSCFLIDYLYDNQDFVKKKIKESKDNFIPFEYGFVCIFLQCETKKEIEEFIFSTCGSMLRDFLSIILCSSKVFDKAYSEVEDLLKKEKTLLDNVSYKNVFIDELALNIKERPGYYKRV